MRRAVLLWALAAAVLAGCGEDREPRSDTVPVPPAGIPEGGSNLGSEVRAQEGAVERETSLLGILAALLERGAPARTDAESGRRGPVRSARELAARLPRSRAAAQVLLAGFAGRDARGTGDLDLGGVLIERRNVTDPVQLSALTAELAARADARGHLPPLVTAVDGVLPGLAATALRRVRGPERVFAAAREAGNALRATGIAMALAPVADLGEEGTFGDDPATVAKLTAAAVRGFTAGGVLAAPGHFPGQGGATQDPLRGPAAVGGTEADLLARGVEPFRTPLRVVVVSNASYTAWDGVTPATLAPQAHALLRDELGFTGVAIADNVIGTAAATGTSVGAAAVAALAAGCDMVLVRDAQERDAVHEAILAALRRGDLPEARLREAVARVLDLKARARAFVPEEPAAAPTVVPGAPAPVPAG